jgi:hypothetical protein
MLKLSDCSGISGRTWRNRQVVAVDGMDWTASRKSITVAPSVRNPGSLLQGGSRRFVPAMERRHVPAEISGGTRSAVQDASFPHFHRARHQVVEKSVKRVRHSKSVIFGLAAAPVLATPTASSCGVFLGTAVSGQARADRPNNSRCWPRLKVQDRHLLCKRSIRCQVLELGLRVVPPKPLCTGVQRRWHNLRQNPFPSRRTSVTIVSISN